MSKLILLIPWSFRIFAFISYLAFATWLLIAPGNKVEHFYPTAPGLDKIFHFLLFGGLVLFARLALRNPIQLSLKSWVVLALSIAYGVATEVAQALLVQYQRSFEWKDILANFLGAFVFWCLSSWLLTSNHTRSDSAVSTEAVKNDSSLQ